MMQASMPLAPPPVIGTQLVISIGALVQRVQIFGLPLGTQRRHWLHS
jgi:hypothetical protein